jgi:hypothetical protein
VGSEPQKTGILRNAVARHSLPRGLSRRSKPQVVQRFLQTVPRLSLTLGGTLNLTVLYSGSGVSPCPKAVDPYAGYASSRPVQPALSTHTSDKGEAGLLGQIAFHIDQPWSAQLGAVPQTRSRQRKGSRANANRPHRCGISCEGRKLERARPMDRHGLICLSRHCSLKCVQVFG